MDTRILDQTLDVLEGLGLLPHLILTGDYGVYLLGHLEGYAFSCAKEPSDIVFLMEDVLTRGRYPGFHAAFRKAGFDYLEDCYGSIGVFFMGETRIRFNAALTGSRERRILELKGLRLRIMADRKYNILYDHVATHPYRNHALRLPSLPSLLAYKMRAGRTDKGNAFVLDTMVHDLVLQDRDPHSLLSPYPDAQRRYLSLFPGK